MPCASASMDQACTHSIWRGLGAANGGHPALGPRRGTSFPAGMDGMDRLQPTIRPRAPAIGFQRWDRLLFLHWEVPPEALRPLLPARLDLDTYEGRAFVSITPFTVRGARLRGLPPLPTLSDFHEVNVRTYVHLGGKDPAVWFFSL